MAVDAPPSVSKIADQIKNEFPDIPLSRSVLLKEARKIQKNWKIGKIAESVAAFPKPKRAVINATGILLHTNLGRAPLGEMVWQRVIPLLTGFCDLELDLATGKRGGRTAYLDSVFESLNSNYKPVWVNNGASAVLLCLSTLKKETDLKKIILSRGEMVEIGGGFRVPEIMAQSGFEIVEIGTTNRTSIKDFRRALEQHGRSVVCRVHPSNFVIKGFTENVEPHELISLCKEFKAPLVYDAGTLDGEQIRNLPKGFTFVTSSTDKTLGGPQGGLVASKPKFQKALLDNPMFRAMRLDKIRIVLLEQVLASHADKNDRKLLPFSAMLNASLDEMEKRANALEKRLNLRSAEIKKVKCTSYVGGGASPEETRESVGLQIRPLLEKWNADTICRILRNGEPSVLVSVINSFATIDLSTVFSSQDELLANALRRLDSTFLAY